MTIFHRLSPYTCRIICKRAYCRSTIDQNLCLDDSMKVNYMVLEDNPLLFTSVHQGRISIVPKTIFHGPQNENVSRAKKNVYHRLAPSDFVQLCDVIDECGILVRKPFLEIKHIIDSLIGENNGFVSQKIVVYGQFGSGKSLSLLSSMYYMMKSDLVLLNFGSMDRWLIKNGEISNSIYNDGCTDHVENSCEALKLFLLCNVGKIEGLKTTKKYQWSIRDVTELNSPLLDVVKTGIDRPQFSTDCLNVLLKELKVNCNAGRCKVAVVIDGINILYHNQSLVDKNCKHYQKLYKPSDIVHPKFAHVDELSAMIQLKKFIRECDKNCVILSTVDKLYEFSYKGLSFSEYKRLKKNSKKLPDVESDEPFALLKTGWKDLHPFIPIEVDKYSRAEFDALVHYLVDRRFLHARCGSELAKQEMYFLSGGNGRDFRIFSSLW